MFTHPPLSSVLFLPFFFVYTGIVDDPSYRPLNHPENILTVSVVTMCSDDMRLILIRQGPGACVLIGVGSVRILTAQRCNGGSPPPRAHLVLPVSVDVADSEKDWRRAVVC
jgi:hypothetical protein